MVDNWSVLSLNLSVLSGKSSFGGSEFRTELFDVLE